jgi:hypothetical protein
MIQLDMATRAHFAVQTVQLPMASKDRSIVRFGVILSSQTSRRRKALTAYRGPLLRGTRTLWYPTEIYTQTRISYSPAAGWQAQTDLPPLKSFAVRRAHVRRATVDWALRCGCAEPSLFSMAENGAPSGMRTAEAVHCEAGTTKFWPQETALAPGASSAKDGSLALRARLSSQF